MKWWSNGNTRLIHNYVDDKRKGYFKNCFRDGKISSSGEN
jgi:hypothetical protein